MKRIRGDKTKFNIAGQPIFAVAGSGDSIAGCIAGFVSLGNDPLSAISAGIYVFTRAGTFCFNEVGYSLDPEAVLNKVPSVMKEILDFNTIAEYREYR
ncbi:MAG: NAD(P)H-hydrate dehydratase [Candidatus Nanoarchaeia archaeon]